MKPAKEVILEKKIVLTKGTRLMYNTLNGSRAVVTK